jgi:hypothetical protein
MSISSSYRRRLDPDAVLRAQKNAPLFRAAVELKKTKRTIRRALIRLGYSGPLLESEIERLTALSLERRAA